jgi:LmbE family N-acetylglucosaminyl deacetylase
VRFGHAPRLRAPELTPADLAIALSHRKVRNVVLRGTSSTSAWGASVGKRVAVLSPHLDDGVFSLGAAIAGWSRAGVKVDVVTVFAGDPNSTLPASRFDRSCGFVTAGEAAITRREEDRRACEILGATPVWLPFEGHASGRKGSDATIYSAVTDAVRRADTVLLPGFPLAHADHASLTRLLLEQGSLAERVGLYVEQPYAFVRGSDPGLTRNLLQNGVTILRTARKMRQAPILPAVVAEVVTSMPTWTHQSARTRDRRAKRQALVAYSSQLPQLGLSLRWRWALAASERLSGGEKVGWFAGPCR